MRRWLKCLQHGHDWTVWKKYPDGCGTPGCDHYLRRRAQRARKEAP